MVFVFLHVLCCTGPILAATFGLAAGAALLATADSVHALAHANEPWILLLSVAFVGVGFALERRAGRWPSRLFLLSACCLALNVAAFGSHHLGLMGAH